MDVPFLIGDLVCHNRMTDDDDNDNEQRHIGHVVGFCPGPQWIRVKTVDGRFRIWLKQNVYNVDFDQKDGNHGATDTGSVT